MKIKLDYDSLVSNSDGYRLDPSEKYVICLDDELENQMLITMTFQIVGPPPALKNYHAWLYENDFSIEAPNPTNEAVACYYGAKPLWKTDYSQGIVTVPDTPHHHTP